ncbi:MAG: DUF3887 domain-containing protein [Candidatus Edwardsbacteria bacterium]|nr:DUF3887 domain-containing protein [Candidatus Edwardsbacteria bacterium]MBU1576177.1 DUF3887 domain-containing protein [Candidatus Edwardsbacteria bacterium]MBU2464657.1 DUF3887 domain-containing protein [Candidatus Edwardsbacteria bacterium]MBU2594232.1 DUF3887 domain-containing protein [Candidatus Edwardsbacteria bacterium]
MKHLFPLLIAIVIGCSSTQKDNKNNVSETTSTSDSTVISFTNNHVQKYIGGDLEAAYNDYLPNFKSAYTIDQFKDMFNKQIVPAFGNLKSASFKSIARGTSYTTAGTFEIATLFYKAEIDKPNTFIRIEIVTSSPLPQVASYQYINFLNNDIPENMK